MYAKIDATANGVNEIVPAVTGKRIRVLSFVMVGPPAASGSAPIKGTWKSAATALTGPMSMDRATSIVAPLSMEGHFETAIGEALNLVTDNANAIGGHLMYVLIG